MQVRLGSSLNPSSLVAGSDVYLECEVRANPPVSEVSWLVDGISVAADHANGIILAKETLVLQRIRRTSRGHYQCCGRNDVAVTKSPPLFLRVLCE